MKFQLPHIDAFITTLGFIYILILGGTLIVLSRIFHFSLHRILKKIFRPIIFIFKRLFHLFNFFSHIPFLRKFAKIRPLLAIISMIVISVGLLLFIFRPKPSSAAWFDDSWGYRQNVAVTNSGSAQTDYQVMITLDTSTLATAGKIQTDCDDLRITDASGKLLKYWLEPTSCNTTTTKIWTKLASLPTPGATLFVYYGNPSASAYADSTPTASVFIREIANLQGAWTLDEASGATRADTSGNGNDLTDNGTVGQVTGQVSTAAGTFLSATKYLAKTDVAALSTGDIDFTIAAWCKTTTYVNSSYGCVGKSVTAGEREWVLYVGNTDFKFWAFDTNGNAISASAATTGASSVTTSTWYYVVAWHDASANTLNIQLNGGSVNSQATTAAPQNSTDDFRIGGSMSVTSNPDINSVDEVRFYKAVLTSAERADLYTYGGAGYTTANYDNIELIRKYSSSVSVASPASEEKSLGPVAFWRFDEGQGTTAEDSTVNNNDGVLSSTYSGDGADGAVTISSNTNINTANSIAGRSCADGGDAVNYSVTENRSAGTNQIVLSSTPSSGCLTAGDEVLIINLQGTTGANSDVGEYEFATISSISSATLTLSANLTNGYDGTTQKIMVQRVPNYTDLTINSGIDFTASDWNGTKGGVMAFRASGTVTVTGNIVGNALGYRGGAGGAAGANGRSEEHTSELQSPCNLVCRLLLEKKKKKNKKILYIYSTNSH